MRQPADGAGQGKDGGWGVARQVVGDTQRCQSKIDVRTLADQPLSRSAEGAEHWRDVDGGQQRIAADVATQVEPVAEAGDDAALAQPVAEGTGCSHGVGADVDGKRQHGGGSVAVQWPTEGGKAGERAGGER